MTGILGLVSGTSLIPALIGGAILAAAAGGAMHYADSTYYGKKISDLKLEQADAASASYKQSLEDFVQQSAVIAGAAKTFSTQQLDLQVQFSSLKESFANASKARPLPPDCKLDSERLRLINSAIAAANGKKNPAPGPSASSGVPATSTP